MLIKLMSGAYLSACVLGIAAFVCGARLANAQEAAPVKGAEASQAGLEEIVVTAVVSKPRRMYPFRCK